MTFNPKITPEKFKAAFSFAKGWARFEQKRDAGEQVSSLTMLKGELTLKSISLAYPEGLKKPLGGVSVNGKTVSASFRVEGDKLVCDFDKELILSAGQSIAVMIK